MANNAPVIVQTRTGTYNVNADLTVGRSVWQVPGTFDGAPSVRLTNAASGWIVAPVVMFERLQ